MAKRGVDDETMLLWPELSLELMDPVEHRDSVILENFSLAQSDGETPRRLTEGGELLNGHDLKAFRKPVAAIHAAPIEADFTLNQMRLFDALIAVVQRTAEQVDQVSVRRIIEERQSPLYTVRATELSRIAGISGNAFERIYADLDKLLKTPFKWNMVGEDESVLFEMKSNLLSTLGIGRHKAQGKIAFAMPPEVLAFALQPKIWSETPLRVTRSFTTTASYTLYQKVWRYSNTHSRSTAALPLATWVQWLAPNTRFLAEGGKGEKVAANYPDFKRRVLVPAIARVNEVDLLGETIELEEITAGRRVVKLRFHFKPKLLAAGLEGLSDAQEIKDELIKLGFGMHEIAKLAEAHGKAHLSGALARFKESIQKAQAGNRKIFSLKRYFEGILGNAVAESDEENRRAEEDARAQQEQLRQQKLAQAQEKLDRLKQEFAVHQSNAFKRAFFELSESDQIRLLEQFSASPQGEKFKSVMAMGIKPGNMALMAGVKIWMKAEQPDVYASLLAEPQDQEFEHWTTWRLTQGA